MYIWNWDWIWLYREQLIDATLLTLWLNVIVLIIGSLFGVLLGLLKRTRYKIFKVIASVYIDLFRTLPVLVLLIWFYFCMPILFDIKISAFTTSVLVLSLNLSAFIAEIVDAGIENIPRNHIESARLLGFSYWQTNKLITLPIALKNMTPPIVSQYINSIKLSVLASVIAVPELLNVSQNIISQTYRPLEFYTFLAVIFLIILLPWTLWSKRLESKSFFKNKKDKN